MYLCRAQRTARRHGQGIPLHTLKSSSSKVLSLKQINDHFRTTSFKEWKEQHIPMMESAPPIPEGYPLQLSSGNIKPTTHSTVPEDPDACLPLPRSEEQCPICLESLRDDDCVREIPCLHCYHHKCIEMWLTTRRGQCPICKRDYAAEFDREELERSGSHVRNSMIAVPETAVTRTTMPAFLEIPRIQDEFDSPSILTLWKHSFRRDI